VLSYPRITERLRLDDAELAAVLVGLLARGEVTPSQLRLPGVTRDSKDDAVIACAVEGRANYIVSGDQDLLALGEYRSIQVVTPRQFVDILR
jgi:putative PIN family toxin of toxin-antitoxin system